MFNKRQLLQTIYDDGNLDYVALCITPFHVISTIAFLMFLQENLKRKLHGLFLISPHGLTGWAIKAENIILPENLDNNIIKFHIEADERYNIQSLIRSGIKLKRNYKSNKKLYIISVDTPWYPICEQVILHTSYDVVAVTVSDGIVFDRKWSIKSLFSVWNGNGFYHLLRLIIREKISPLFTKLLNVDVINFKISKNCFFDSKEEVLEYYRKSMTFLGKKQQYDLVNKAVIFANMPRYSDTEEDYNAKISIVVKILQELKKRGYTIYLKNHPRDAYLKLPNLTDIIVIPANYSLESILAASEQKPKMLISVGSTGIFIGALWRVECYMLYDLMPQKYQCNYTQIDELCKIFNNQKQQIYLKSGKDLIAKLEYDE